VPVIEILKTEFRRRRRFIGRPGFGEDESS
jgi:hypothetical protein